VRDESDSEVAGRTGDAPIQGRVGSISRPANLSECWHFVRWTG